MTPTIRLLFITVGALCLAAFVFAVRYLALHPVAP